MSENEKGLLSSKFIYLLGTVGAAVFFINGTPTIWEGIIGVFKALVWPAFLVFRAFEFFA